MVRLNTKGIRHRQDWGALMIVDGRFATNSDYPKQLHGAHLSAIILKDV
jgi:Rad3-related DNA helicase